MISQRAKDEILLKVLNKRVRDKKLNIAKKVDDHYLTYTKELKELKNVNWSKISLIEI